jgi:hypothetical protein
MRALLGLSIGLLLLAPTGLWAQEGDDADEWGDDDGAVIEGGTDPEGEATEPDEPGEPDAEEADDGDAGDEDEWGDDDGAVIEDRAPPPLEPLPAPTESPATEPPADPAGGDSPFGEAPAEPPPAAEPPAAEPPAAEAPAAEPPAAEPPAGGEPSAAPDDALVAEPDEPGGRRVGDPFPLTKREPLLKQFGLEFGVRYSLVGTGPTRFVDDIRFGLFDWLELRTALLPHPASLMARVKIGAQQGPFGAVVLDGGLAYFDAGIRLTTDTGEPAVGFRFHWEGIASYQLAFLDQFAIHASARYRWRQSMLTPQFDDDTHAIAVDGTLTYDLLPWLALSGGVGYAQTLFDTTPHELAVGFVETDRPGMSHFLLRDDGETQSLTIPLAMTYGRVENFDVDLFSSIRAYPKFDILFGAGVRWRLWFGEMPG